VSVASGVADVGVVSVAALVESLAVPAESAWWAVQAVDKVAVARRAAIVAAILTAKASTLREYFSPSGHIDRRNVSPVGDLVPEVAGAVAGVLASVADGLADDADPGAV
jgi:hypothetical protein